MASMAFSTTLFTPLHDFNQPKVLNPNSSSPSWPSMASFIVPFIKTSFASSNSPFFQLGFSQTTSNFPRFLFKPRSFGVHARAATEKTIYDFTVKDIDRKDVSLSKLKGKVLLIVNVASRCGLTSSNHSELTRLYEKYKNRGLEILAFPCNQFGGQEPGSNPEIKQFACTRFKAEFPIFDKFLKASAGGFLGDLIKWNFEKFLVDKDGKVVERYPPTTSPFQIEKDIQRLLVA